MIITTSNTNNNLKQDEIKRFLNLRLFMILKGIGDFYKLILFCRVLFELSEILNCLKKFKVVFEIWAIKVGDRNRFLMEGAN